MLVTSTGPLKKHPAQPSPFIEVSREAWSQLAPDLPDPLTVDEIAQIRSFGDHLDLTEVAEVYLPVSRLLNLFAANTRTLNQQVTGFLRGDQRSPVPFVIGVAGSVAVGKSTVARLLRELLSRWEHTPKVQLVTTDGFLLPNAELERRGILHRKGFPESYNQRALLKFMATVKGGAEEVRAPYYSHLHYNIVPGKETIVQRPDVLIVEGLNVLQPPANGTSLAVSDFFDFGVYVDARTSDIEQWYLDRFLSMQRIAFANPESYFHRYATMSEDEAREFASGIWKTVNEPNLRQNIHATRSRADLVLRKSADHTVSKVLLRKL